MMDSTTQGSTGTDLVLRLNGIDIAVIVIFLAIVLGIGIWVGASLFASNISSISMIGMAGSGASTGIAVAAYELNGMFVLMLLGWIFVPVYLASGIITMPEYIRHRFGGERIRLYLAVLCILLYIFTKISTDLYSGAIFIQQSLGWSLYPSILGLLLITVVFTITGGLTAVIYTDALAALVMLIGSTVLMILSFIEVGGYSGLKDSWSDAIPADANGSCGLPPENAFHLFREASDPDYPWPGVVFGITILSTWYFCTDQVLAQRSLASKNLLNAKGGSVLAALLKTTLLFLMGLRGLMIAAVLAALMSSLTSVFNSAATVVSIDLWKSMRPRAADLELMIVGRMFVAVLATLSILWIPILTGLQSGRMMEYVQSVSSFLSPPICACYVLAILWLRMNESGAFWGLAVGLVCGLIRMAIEFSNPAPACGTVEYRPQILTSVSFLHFAIILFAISSIVTVLISLVTPPPEKERLPALTWWTRFQMPIYTDKSYDKYQEPQESTEHETTKPPQFWRRALDFVCGCNPNQTSKENSEPMERKRVSGKVSLYQDPTWTVFVNICCIVVMSVGVFLWSFFA